MTGPTTKKCEVCGEIKPVEDFSKSYRNRCKPCVAEMRRNSRIVSDMMKKPDDSEYKKARIRTSGELVEVIPLGFARTCNISMFRTKDSRDIPQYALQFEPEIDWEQRRYEIANNAMAAIMTNHDIAAGLASGRKPIEEVPVAIAKMSLEFADALIAELQKGDAQ